MKILVFDDSRVNRVSAKLSLEGHDLTIVGTYDEAQEALLSQTDHEQEGKNLSLLRMQVGLPEDFKYWDKETSPEDKEKDRLCRKEASERATTHPDFDVVLTDLLVPASKQAQGREGMRFIGQEMPLGSTIALLALTAGVKNVAVVTDMNHHHHPASAAFDCFRSNKAEGINILCTNHVGSVAMDEATGEAVDRSFLDSAEGKAKFPFEGSNDWGPRQGLTWGKDWGRVLKQLLGEDEED